MRRKTVSIVFCLFCVLTIASLVCAGTHNAGRYAASDEWIEIMFEWGYEIRIRDGIPVDISRKNRPVATGILEEFSDISWHRIADVDERFLDYLQYEGERNLGTPLYNLNNIYKLHVPGGADIWELATQIEALPHVMSARPFPLPMALPLPPNYQPNQGYLNPASSSPTGINATYAWTQTGGDGSGVTVCDIEYDWNYSHLDVTKASGSQIQSGCTTGLPVAWEDHGTASVGMLVANSNGWGITGICYGANLLTCCTLTGASPGFWDVAAAITLAISNLSAGDVILLEQQWNYSSDPIQEDYIPIEWWGAQDGASQGYNAVYAAIQNAVGNGIHVIEPAGNGGYDLDTLNWYGDSGAIIVGAGGVSTSGSWPEGDLERIFFSSYGSRVNVQGWGENVYTTGYGDLYSAEGSNYYYTSTFAGTSSASAMVAGAVACCVGYWTQGLGYSALSLTPLGLRTVLINTGTSQVTPPSGHIGPRPDLMAAFQSFDAVTPTPTPDVTATPTPTMVPPVAEFGDAPDETTLGTNVWDAYPGISGMQAARFPTLFNTVMGNQQHGACFITSTIYLSAANIVPSLELDAIDPFDPDGAPNINPSTLMADQDAWPAGDDGVVFSFDPPGVTIYLQGGPGHFSLLGDLNQDGDWSDPGERLIFDHLAGMIGAPEFIPIPSGFGSATGDMWFRAVVSEHPLAVYLPPEVTWDGSLPAPGWNGEVEDYIVTISGPGTPTATPVPGMLVPTQSVFGYILLLAGLTLAMTAKRLNK
jgi:serine protease